MFGFGKKFKGVDKKYINDQEHWDDYSAAEAMGRVRLGKLCFYYKDLGKKYFVPYDYIERVYTKEEMVQPDDSPAYFYYRIILLNSNKEFANLIFEKREIVERIYDELKLIAPHIKFGKE